MLRVHLDEVRSILGRPPISDVATPHGRFLTWHDAIPLEVARLRRRDTRSPDEGASVNILAMVGDGPGRSLVSVYAHLDPGDDAWGDPARARPGDPIDAEPVAELVRRHVLALRLGRYVEVEELMADAAGGVWRVVPGLDPEPLGSPRDREVAALIDAYQVLRTGRVTRYEPPG